MPYKMHSYFTRNLIFQIKEFPWTLAACPSLNSWCIFFHFLEQMFPSSLFQIYFSTSKIKTWAYSSPLFFRSIWLQICCHYLVNVLSSAKQSSRQWRRSSSYIIYIILGMEMKAFSFLSERKKLDLKIMFQEKFYIFDVLPFLFLSTIYKNAE